MLVRELFIVSSTKYYFGNPAAWYTEWLGTVDRRYLAYHSDLRIPLPFLWHPPGIGYCAAHRYTIYSKVHFVVRL